MEYMVIATEFGILEELDGVLVKLTQRVNAAIAKGWRPQGGVTTYTHKHNKPLAVMQAMVR